MSQDDLDNNPDWPTPPMSIPQGNPNENPAAPVSNAIPKQFGSYEIVKVLGEGGMGVVYEAKQQHPFRHVALKVIKPGLMSASGRKRFTLEADTMAKLHHPMIASIFEAGSVNTPLGSQSYFAMELVQGLPLHAYIQAHPDLPTRRRLELLAKIADAVQFAHQNGVIHRDLKPDNILVAEDGNPKILDFGVARITVDDNLTAATETGALVGTLRYMAPEQTRGDGAVVDARADVYSLGVIGFEMLSGRLPYNVLNLPTLRIIHTIQETEPTRLRTINRGLRGDVETIILKALEKSPERRYQTAGDLAADIRKYLDQKPIVARPPSTLYQVRKFAARNRILVAAVACVFLALVIGTTIAVREAVLAIDARKQSDAMRQTAEENALTARAAEAEAVARNGHFFDARELYQKLMKSPQLSPASRMEGRVNLWASYTNEPSPLNIRKVPDSPRGMAYSAPLGLVALGGHEKSVLLFDVVTWSQVAKLAPMPGEITAIAVSRDGNVLVAGDNLGNVNTWDLPSRELKVSDHAHTKAITSIRFSPAGVYVSFGEDGRVVLWQKNLGGKAEETTVSHQACTGDWISQYEVLVGTATNFVYVLNLLEARREFIQQLDTGITQVVAAADGKSVLLGMGDTSVALFDLETRKITRRFRYQAGAITGIAAWKELSNIVTSSKDGTCVLWDMRTETTSGTLEAQKQAIDSVVLSPDESLIFSGGQDSVGMWLARNWRSSQGIHTHVVLSADQKRWREGHVACALTTHGTIGALADDKVIRLFDPAMRTILAEWSTGGADCMSMAFSPDDRTLSVGTRDGKLVTFDVATGKSISEEHVHASPLTTIRFSSDGRAAIAGFEDGTIIIRKGESVAGIQTITPTANSAIVDVAFLDHDRQIAFGRMGSNEITIADVATGKTLRTLNVGTTISVLAIDGPKNQALCSGPDFVPALWNLATGKTIQTFEPMNSEPTGAVIAADRDMVLVSDSAGCLLIYTNWSPKTVRSFTIAQGPVRGMTMSPQNGILVAHTPPTSLWLSDLDLPDEVNAFQQPLDVARRTLETNPDDPQSLIEIGKWYCHCEAYTLAIQAFERAQTHGGTVPPMLAGFCYWKTGNTAKAHELFLRARNAHDAPDWYIARWLEAPSPLLFTIPRSLPAKAPASDP